MVSYSSRKDLIYCHDFDSLMNEFDIEYKKEDWRFFIDSSKTSLKGVLSHNGNTYSSLPIAHSVYMKETYKTQFNRKLTIQLSIGICVEI